jgi:hypothetical protein
VCGLQHPVVYRSRAALRRQCVVGKSWRALDQNAQVFGPRQVVFQPLRHWLSQRHCASEPGQFRLSTPVGIWRINSLLDDQKISAPGQSGPVSREGLIERLNTQGHRLGLNDPEMTG